jgi:hypothetical protein
MNKIDGDLPAAGGHASTISTQLSAIWVQIEFNWLPVACCFCMRMAATLIQFVRDWSPDAQYFSNVWQPVACKITN